VGGGKFLLISLVVTACSTRDPQLQWYLAPTLGHIGGHIYLSSMRKQVVALLAALQTVFTGQPLYPAFE
jgi:pyridoxal/pyridoxine/pyridoxamine kinase